MKSSYSISRILARGLAPEELHELFAGRSVDLGWWARTHGIITPPQNELGELPEGDAEEALREWLTADYGRNRADLLSEYADGYYQGARDLLNCFIQKKNTFSDSEALPVLFLLCQFAELALKASIEHMLSFRRFSGKSVPELDLNTHDLCALLSYLATLTEPNEPFLSEDTQEFVRKIHAINEIAQAFRYPFSARDRVFLIDAPLVPMKALRAEFDIHGRELNGFHQCLGEYYQGET